MKIKTSKRKGKKAADIGDPAGVGAINAAAATESQPMAQTVIHLEFPPPEHLLSLVDEEPNRKVIEEYREVIGRLREEKGFSFREIADWLTENGVPADYNSVYRAYTKGMREDEQQELDRNEAMEGE